MSLLVKDNNSTFEKLVLTPDEYKKCRINSREISYNGNMYDVNSVKIYTDKVELFVINDSKETGILEAIKDFVHETSQHNKGYPNIIQHYFSLNYISPETDYTLLIAPFFEQIFPDTKSDIISNDSDVSTPPPELV